MLELLTVPEAIARWAPVPFELAELAEERLLTGSQARDGTEVHASVSVAGRGLFGRVVAKATETVLAAGALRASLERLGRELQPALAA